MHSLILHTNAPVLANHFGQGTHSNIIVEGISAAIFKSVLVYVYTEQLPSNDQIFKHGKELIDAANKYDLTNLKMAVEHVLVRERILTRENVCDYILFADAQSCPLLKEYAIAFFLLNSKDVLKSEYSTCLRESSDLLSEILMIVGSNNETDSGKTLTVNELRLELSKRKLDADGSKEVLLSRLEEAKRQRIE